MTTRKHSEILENLFLTAFKKNTFHFLATILRFDGMHFGHWDPFEESKNTFSDLSELMKVADESGNRAREIKLALLMYCHAIEMSQPHQVLANLLRLCGGMPFKFRALWDEEFMKRRRKQKSIFFRPQTLGRKVTILKELAEGSGFSDLASTFDSLFNFQIRNSFSHSDYCIDLDASAYRYTEGGPGQEISIQELDEILNNCFEFYSEFFRILDGWHYEAAKMPRYHKFPDYQVLELLSEEGRLFGFKIHHSNGSNSSFERKQNSVLLKNFEILEEGIGVFVGNLDELKKAWYVGNVLVEDFDELNAASRLSESTAPPEGSPSP